MTLNKTIIFGISLILASAVIYSNGNIDPLEEKIVGNNSSFSQSYYNYNDVILVINNNSQISKDVGYYFKTQRNINDSNIIYINTIDGEDINLSDFNNYIRFPIERFLISNNLTNSTNYIVTTKGIPLKIADLQRSVDSELTLILGPYNNSIGVNTKIVNPYYAKNETFSRDKFGIYLVTRLTGYNYTSVKNLIDRASNTTNNGIFVFDIAPKGGGYQIFNDEMIIAAKILEEKGCNVILDNTTKFLTDQHNVLGYVSWGSNDPESTDHAKPHNTWVPGAIAETAVSSSGRTFDNPSYGQSLIADLIEEGVTGAKGYVYEPYLGAMAQPDILFPRYVEGYNLAESYYMASLFVGWTDLIVGDPKTVLK